VLCVSSLSIRNRPAFIFLYWDMEARDFFSMQRTVYFRVVIIRCLRCFNSRGIYDLSDISPDPQTPSSRAEAYLVLEYSKQQARNIESRKTQV